jgi:hypothetical protein
VDGVVVVVVALTGVFRQQTRLDAASPATPILALHSLSFSIVSS